MGAAASTSKRAVKVVQYPDTVRSIAEVVLCEKNSFCMACMALSHVFKATCLHQKKKRHFEDKS